MAGCVVVLMAIAGSLPAKGGPAAAGTLVVLTEVRLGGSTMEAGAHGRGALVPLVLPQASLRTGRLEPQAPPPVAWMSSGVAAAKALPSSGTTLPVGCREVVAVGTVDVCAPGGGAHPWRPG